MLTRENVDEKLEKYEIPEYMRGGIKRYLFDNIPPDSFLKAVFDNDLKMAFATADPTNKACMENYARLLIWEMPA